MTFVFIFVLFVGNRLLLIVDEHVW